MKRLKSPAKWYKALISEINNASDDHSELLARRKLESELEFVKNAIKTARRFYDGFDSSDGWTLRHVGLIPDAEILKVKGIYSDMAQLLAEPHIIKRPKSKAARTAYANYSSQSEKQKAYVIIKHPSERVRLKTKTIKIKPKKKGGKVKTTKSVSVEVRREFDDGELVGETFFFRDFSRTKKFYKFEQLESALKKMMPHLPEGEYVIVSRLHGNIASHASKRKLLDYFADRFYDYSKISGGEKDNRGIFEDLIGVRLTAFKQHDAANEYVERQSRRYQMQKNREAMRAKKRATINKKLIRKYL